MSNEGKFFVASSQPTEPRRTSSLGIASVILGALAFMICWIPFVGALGMPLSALGFFLALIGLVVALTRGGVGIGFPIAGMAICGLALLIAGVLTSAASQAVVETAKAMNKRNETNQTVVTAPGTPQASKSEEREAPKSEAERWAPSTLPIQQGEVQVEITSVKVDFVSVKGALGRSQSKEKHLVIVVRVTNLSRSRKISYTSWAGRMIALSSEVAQLKDNVGNEYKRIGFGLAERVEGQADDDSIYPGKELNDVLVFEVPVEGYDFLKLELPAENFGGTGMVRFTISHASVNAK